MIADDTYLVSYPRSGSTWLRRLIATALFPGVEWGMQNIDRIVPDLHRVGRRPETGLRPRLFKSHEAYRPAYPRVIYLYRDGRDVAVSYFDYYATTQGFDGGFERFFIRYLSGRVRFGRCDEHVRSWMLRQTGRPLLAMSYETLCRNTELALTTVLEFIGRDVPAGAIARSAETCTFERHREDIRRHSSDYLKGYRGGVKGAPGRWREVFSETQSANFFRAMGRTLDRLGYTRE